MPKPRYYMVSTFERGLKMLELLVERKSLSVSEAATALGIQRSASHRFLSTLKELGYVKQDDMARYTLTSRLSRLASGKVPSADVKQLARPFLEELARIANETINLGHWNGTHVCYMDQIHCKEMLRADLYVGSCIPSYCSALGKSILAFLPDSERDDYVRTTELKPMTPNTICEKESLIRELYRIRERGYAIDNEELGTGIRAVAAPVLITPDYPRYALSIAGPAFRMTDDKLGSLTHEIMRVSRELSECLAISCH